jgi:hypothetical protein
MSRRIPDAAQLELLRDTFRKQPPSAPRDFKAAGVRAGVSEPAARRAYERGWPGIESIAKQLAREQEHARQSAEVLKAERMVGTLKTSAQLLQAELRRLQPAVKALTDGLLTSLEDLGAMLPNDQIKALQRVAKLHKDVAAITAKAVELDRLLAGEATSISIVKHVEGEPVAAEELQAEIDAATRALRRMQPAAKSAAEPLATKDTTDVDTSVN